MTEIADCTQYGNGLSAAAVPATLKLFGCMKCGSSKYPLVTITGTTNPTTVDDTAGTLTCASDYTSGNITMGTIDGCDRRAYADANAAGGMERCLLCSSGRPAHTNGKECKASTDSMVDTNCDQEASDGSAIHCYYAKTGFALTSTTANTTAAFTADANCRVAGTDCLECKDTYWFSGSTCVSSAKMMILSFATLLAA